MPKPGKKRRFVFLSIFLSATAHVILLAILAGVQFNLHGLAHKQASTQPPRKMRIQSVDLHKLVFDQNRKRDLPPSATVGFQNPNKNVRNLFEKMDLLPKPPPVAELAGLGKNVIMPESKAAAPPEMPAAPPVKIVEIDAAKLAADRTRERDHLIARVDRVQLLGDRAPGLTGVGGGGGGEAVKLGMRLGGTPDIPLRPDELDALNNKNATIEPVAPPIVTGRNGTSGNLDSLVTVSMTVYNDPDTKGGGFYRIDISPNTASNRLRSIPKDVLFLLDCSNSISAPKLEQFKTGIIQLLPQLRGTDRFNIVAFRDRSEPMFTKLVPVNDLALKSADAFVRQQVHGGLTDVYNSLTPLVTDGETNAAYRPLNIFLLSDGKSTVQNKPDNDSFIRNVAKMRRNHISIYSFSAGTNANLFLMDLLAYGNRGGSMHVENVSQFSAEMVNFIQAHTDLIVADLRYHATGDLAKEIFPRQLPHLYRGETLSVYGRFPAGTGTVGLQFIGRDADGKEEELVFTGDLRTAPRGDAKIAQEWAGQKVFTLLLDRVMDPKARVSDEIRRLAQTYGFAVPYL